MPYSCMYPVPCFKVIFSGATLNLSAAFFNTSSSVRPLGKKRFLSVFNVKNTAATGHPFVWYYLKPNMYEMAPISSGQLSKSRKLLPLITVVLIYIRSPKELSLLS